MTSTGHSQLGRRCAAALGLGLLFGAPCAQAQNFETYYGEAPWQDRGEDVKSVNVCRREGSIVVGTRTAPDGTRQALVTQALNDGTIYVQRAFRVGGSKNTTANAVVELSSGKGFALTGSVEQNGSSYIYVLEIDCKSNPIWATILANPKDGTVATGYDIVEVADPAAARGELVVIGDDIVDRSREVTQGRIARLNAAGAVLWSNVYARSDVPLGLRFRAVTQNLGSGSSSSDLVIAGSTAEKDRWDIYRRALMFRVDAAGTPICNAVLGLPEEENRDYFGLTPLRTSDYAGDTVLVGAAATYGKPSAAYLTRFTRATCNPKEQSIWIDRKGAEAVAYDAVEAIDRDGSVGSVVAAGSLSGGWTRNQGILLAARIPDLLMYAPLPPKRFGGATDDPDSLLRAIDLKADRFVAAGSTYTDWDGVGDREDFYLVQTDPAMGTTCSKPWEPAVEPVDVPPARFEPKVQRFPRYTQVQVEAIDAVDMGYCCKADPPEGRCDGVIDNGTVQLGVSDTGYLNVECSTSQVSSGRYGTTLVGLRYMPTNGDASAPGAPCEGWGVASADQGISGRTSRCSGTANVAVSSFSFTPSTATSVVTVGSTFRVTHQYTPTGVTPYLYRVDVTIENIGRKDVADLRYTRGVDYDVPPNTFSEYVTISGTSGSPYVIGANDNGFNSPDPLASDTCLLCGLGDFTDLGPGDLGAHIDFALGALPAGQSRSFVTYYGAAPDEWNALNALSMVGASIYSLGQSNWDGTGSPTSPSGAPTGTYGASTGEPATFMYGFVPRF